MNRADCAICLRITKFILSGSLFLPSIILAQSIIYQYDVNQRLVGIGYESSSSIKYTYDAVGNRITETVANTPLQQSAIAARSAEAHALEEEALLINSLVNTGVGGGRARGFGKQMPRTARSESPAASKEGEDDDASIRDAVIYEDAEDGKTVRWKILEEGPQGAILENIYDNDPKSQVISFKGDPQQNIFLLSKTDGTSWNDTSHPVIQWSMKTADDFTVSVAVQTSHGPRFLSFTPEATDSLGKGPDIFYGLGERSKDGQWHTYTIDLEYALHRALPDADLVSLQGLYISGRGLIDNTQSLKNIPESFDSNGNGLPDVEEIKAGRNPYH